MIGIFIIISNLVALVTLLALPAHAKSIRSAAVEAPMCRRHGNQILDLIQRPHLMNVVGTDSKFDEFASEYIQHVPTLKSKDFWLFEEEDSATEARLRRRLENDDSDSYNYRLCKSDPTVERRFDRFPFVKISWTCKKNTRIVKIKNVDFDCIPIQEERPILKIADGCMTFGSKAEETWIHSTETVNTGCQAVLKLRP